MLEVGLVVKRGASVQPLVFQVDQDLETQEEGDQKDDERDDGWNVVLSLDGWTRENVGVQENGYRRLPMN